MEHPLQPVCAAWIRKIKCAYDHKEKTFQKDANEAMRFFNGPYDWLYTQGLRSEKVGMSVEDYPEPTMRMQTNRVAEMVQLFGPALYHKNPHRDVTPRQYPQIPPEFYGNPADPRSQMLYQMVEGQAQNSLAQDQARAVLLDGYLNFTPYELNLKDAIRGAVDECIIKGMGVLWTEIYRVPGSGWRMAGSFYDSVDNLMLDPDAECLDDCQWIARRCIHPVWMVERDYGLVPGSLKGNLTSFNQSMDNNAATTYWRQRGETADLLVYWKVFSKMGCGARLGGVPHELQTILDGYGDYCFLAIAEDIPYPLNLPPEITESAPDSEIIRRFNWPTPYWKDGSWPFTPFVFHPVPRQLWPMSHVKPGMGELKFLNWGYSFLASKMRVSSRDFIAILKSQPEDFKKNITHGGDMTVIELDSMNKKIDEAVQFLQHPPMNKDILTVMEAVSNQFDKRVGLTELMYGGTAHQFRSASEAEVKNDQLKIRPDDMNARVEEAATELAKKEAICARTHLTQQDVEPILGPAGAYFWNTLISQGTPDDITRQLQYRIEAGSTRKPNRERQAANMVQAMQNMAQPLFQFAAQTGNVQPYNALVTDWAKSIDLDPKPYLLTMPQMAPAVANHQQELNAKTSPSANGAPKKQPAGAQ